MRETIEFRIRERHARESLPDNVGQRLGDSVRRVVVATNSPLFDEIQHLYRKLAKQGESLFYSWNSRRAYSPREMEAAELFYIWPKKAFEPTGEQCGTVYDDTEACNHVFCQTEEWEVGGHKMPASVESCGAGGRQVTPLFLDGRRIPRKWDFSRTLADEVVVSTRVHDVFRHEGLRGADFDAVRLCDKGGRPSTEYSQFNVIGPRVELDSSVRAGKDPFDESAYGRCPYGHTVGLGLLSEVTVRRSSLNDIDIMATRQLLGTRGGVIRPSPILLISPKAWRAIEKHKLKGLTIEVAHVV